MDYKFHFSNQGGQFCLIDHLKALVEKEALESQLSMKA